MSAEQSLPRAGSPWHCLNNKENPIRFPLAMTLMLAGAVSAAANAADPAVGAAARSQREVAAAYALLANMKRSVAQAYATSGSFPPTYPEAKLDGPIKGMYFSIELGSEGKLEIKFNESADPLLTGKELKAVPTINENGDVVWYCLAPNIPKNILPQVCL